jgi:YD repeat-containing protein
VSSLTLPNGQSYTFGYDQKWGLVNSITYPTGAKVTYTWGVNSKSESYNAATPDNWNSFVLNGGKKDCYFRYDLPVVKTRIVSFDGTNPSMEQDFSYSTTWGTNGFWSSKKTTVTTTDLVRPSNPKTVTVYNYIPRFPPLLRTGSSSKSVIPTEDSVLYQGGSGNTLRKIKKVWLGIDLLGAECEILDNGKVSGKFYQYQQFSSPAYVWSSGMSDQVTDLAEYDYGQGVTSACTQPASATSPARETKTQYASIPSSTLWQPASAAAIPQTNDRPSVIQVYDHGSLLSETDLSYDQTAISSVSPLAYNHDETNFGPGQIPGRGNPTTITKKCFQSCPGDSTITAQYDETGQIVAVTDANGNASGATAADHTTKLSYKDNYSTGGTPPGNTNTYVTSITRPTTNGVKHQSSFTYEYTFGELTASTDENGQKTTYQYNDTWGRPTLVSTPDGGQTTLTYNDNPPSPSFTSDELITSASSLTTTSIEDGLGRIVQTQLTSDPKVIYTSTSYDAFGRTYQTSNPYRSASEATYGLTTYSYDALGRTTNVTRPDGSSAVTSYTGRATSVLDEGNGTSPIQRISQFDGLGRLSSVCEVTSSTQFGSNGSPAQCGQDITAIGFLTSYQYDALGNLSGVQQGALSRSFAYDSLSRLLTATNPESGTTTYTFDSNGNVITRKRPAANQTNGSVTVATTYSYDFLNRLTSTTYSDSKTPSITRKYDTTLELGLGLDNTIGRLSAEYVKAPSGTTLSGKVYSYDPLGHVIDNSQCTPQNCASSTAFSVTYGYNLLGQTQSSSNGQGIVLTSSYDGAARLSTLTSSLSDVNHPGTLFSGPSYSPFGSLTAASLGNALNEARVYDCRGRVIFYTSVVSPNLPSTSGVNNTGGCPNSTAMTQGTNSGILTSSLTERLKLDLIWPELNSPPFSNRSDSMTTPWRAWIGAGVAQ